MRKILFVSILALGGCGSDDGGNGNGDGGNCIGTDCKMDGGGNDDGGNPASACRKLDVVFAVDPSSSMEDELAAMSNDVFPSFAQRLMTVGDGLEDYRVGVIDACPLTPEFRTSGATEGACNFESGSPWMTSESSDLEGEFSCVGDIPSDPAECLAISSQDEQPMAATIASLTGGSNPGFLRDDALLVVVNITDEDECLNAPNCSPQSDAEATNFYNDLVAIKGDVRKMVMLGIGGGEGGCTLAEGAYGEATHAVLLDKVTQLFIGQERGVFWDLCDGELADGLGEAIAVIDRACRAFPTVD